MMEDYHDALLVMLTKAMDAQEDLILRGQVGSLENYREGVGYLNGLKHAVGCMRVCLESFEDDEDNEQGD